MINLDRQENVGTLGSYIRVSGGLVLLALATFGRFGRLASWAMFALGASSVASGVARYCPVTEALMRRSHGGEAEGDDEASLSRDFPWETETGRSPDAPRGAQVRTGGDASRRGDGLNEPGVEPSFPTGEYGFR